MITEVTKINEKGQVGVATTVIVALVVGVVGLTVLQGITSPMYEAQGVTNETGNFTSTGYTNLAESDLATDSETVYNNTSCSTSLADTEYTMNYTDGGIIMADASYDGYNQCIDYDHYADDYVNDGTLRTVLQNIGVLFAVGLLIGAVGWYSTKT